VRKLEQRSAWDEAWKEEKLPSTPCITHSDYVQCSLSLSLSLSLTALHDMSNSASWDDEEECKRVEVFSTDTRTHLGTFKAPVSDVSVIFTTLAGIGKLPNPPANYEWTSLQDQQDVITLRGHSVDPARYRIVATAVAPKSPEGKPALQHNDWISLHSHLHSLRCKCCFSISLSRCCCDGRSF
jgi:hypothetical protein